MSRYESQNLFALRGLGRLRDVELAQTSLAVPVVPPEPEYDDEDEQPRTDCFYCGLPLTYEYDHSDCGGDEREDDDDGQ